MFADLGYESFIHEGGVGTVIGHKVFRGAADPRYKFRTGAVRMAIRRGVHLGLANTDFEHSVYFIEERRAKSAILAAWAACHRGRDRAKMW